MPLSIRAAGDRFKHPMGPLPAQETADYVNPPPSDGSVGVCSLL